MPRFSVFDAHVDALQRQLDLGHDLGRRTPGHFDIERAREGGVEAVVLVSWVDPKHIELGGARARTALLLREFHRLVRTHPERVAFAGNARMLAGARTRSCVAGIPGIEGGHSIEEDLDHLRWFFERGVRVMTLVWNNHLSWIRSCQPGAGASIPEGLSAFGKSVVGAMNELGMVVDLSHAGERSFYDALDTTSKPVIASHSGCKALHAHVRNLTDDQLRALAQNGGVVGIVFCTPFLSAAAQREDARVRETDAYVSLQGTNDTDEFLRKGEYLQSAATPLPIDVVVDHVLHAIDVAGIEHVGIGSDYDGILRTPRGLEDASCYGALADALVARGLGAKDVALVMSGNMERVFAAATGPGTEAETATLVALDA